MLVHSLYVQYRAEVKKIYSTSEKSRPVSAQVPWLKCPPLTNCCSISARDLTRWSSREQKNCFTSCKLWAPQTASAAMPSVRVARPCKSFTMLRCVRNCQVLLLLLTPSINADLAVLGDLLWYVMHSIHCYLWPPCIADVDIIFLPCGFFLLSFFYSSPNLSGRRLDVCHTSTHGVALVRI